MKMRQNLLTHPEMMVLQLFDHGQEMREARLEVGRGVSAAEGVEEVVGVEKGEEGVVVEATRTVMAYVIGTS
jgi:hypothetical protein